MAVELGDRILQKLHDAEPGARLDTAELATEFDVEQQAVVGAVKSLQARELIVAEVSITKFKQLPPVRLGGIDVFMCRALTTNGTF